MNGDFVNKNVAKNDMKYLCNFCNYNTSNLYDFNKHNNTIKHKNCDKSILSIVSDKISQETKIVCENCNKKYKDNSGLWRHKKKCIYKESIIVTKNSIITEDKTENKDELINYLIKENQEFKSLILEIIKKDTTTSNINNINTINIHNKTFNIKFFLNETCKNAMNINDFVDSIKLQISDLESVGKIGYIEGLSKIIIKNLNALDVTERPVHCSDTKRDTMYVKDDDKWEKEAEDNHIILKAIEDIANKNTKQIKEWKKLNPECASSKSHKADVYSHIMIQALCSNNDVNNKKVLKKIAKEVAIDKY